MTPIQRFIKELAEAIKGMSDGFQLGDLVSIVETGLAADAAYKEIKDLPLDGQIEAVRVAIDGLIGSEQDAIVTKLLGLPPIELEDVSDRVLDAVAVIALLVLRKKAV